MCKSNNVWKRRENGNGRSGHKIKKKKTKTSLLRVKKSKMDGLVLMKMKRPMRILRRMRYQRKGGRLIQQREKIHPLNQVQRANKPGNASPIEVIPIGESSDDDDDDDDDYDDDEDTMEVQVEIDEKTGEYVAYTRDPNAPPPPPSTLYLYWCTEPFSATTQFTNHSLASSGLFTLSDTDSDPNPGTGICPKNEYSSNWGSECKEGSESESVRCEHVPHSTM